MNPHPILVHFPVSLLAIYSLMELLRFRKLLNWPSWFYIKGVFVVLGALGALAAVWAGDYAKEAVLKGNGTGYPGLNLRAIIGVHENFADATLIIFGLLACAYLVAFANKYNFIEKLPGQFLKIIWKIGTGIEKILIETFLVVMLAVVGLVCVTSTGALGGTIVYGPNVDPAVHIIDKILIPQYINVPEAPANTTTPVSAGIIHPPLTKALSRITKKPFGIYVTPKDSPVSPEKFTGYHTGTDFEVADAEQDADVIVSAVCDGKILTKKWATGYGGVVVESCKINGQDVTVIYGHLNVDSVSWVVGETIKAGDNLGKLGQGYSQQTDDERKHLHLGIHIGNSVNILGYVQNKADLSQWLDAKELLQ